MPEIADAYRATRVRVRDLLAGAPPDATGRVVPAAPDWTVHDVVAHLAGVAADLVEGRLDGLATDPWTATQVERGRSRSIPELLAEWDEHGAAVDAFADALGPGGGQLVFDATTHEHDLRGACGNTDARRAVSRFELVRAASGRRSLDQLRAYRWDGDAHADLLPLAPIFVPRAEALVE